jgi:hypothetical protein
VKPGEGGGVKGAMGGRAEPRERMVLPTVFLLHFIQINLFLTVNYRSSWTSNIFIIELS